MFRFKVLVILVLQFIFIYCMSNKNSNHSINSSNSNKYRDIAGYLNFNKPISPRALLKDITKHLNLPTNATLLDPSKIQATNLLDKTIKFYNAGQTFNVDKKDINDCYTILLKIDDDQIIGAVTFAPFIQETELIIYILLIKAKENLKGTGTILFNIVKEFATKCHQSTECLQILLLLSASTALAPHGFFKKQGCEVVIDRDLLKLTQKDSTLMQFDFDHQKGGDSITNSRDIIIEESKNNIVNVIEVPQQQVPPIIIQRGNTNDVTDNVNDDDESESRQLEKEKNNDNLKEFGQLQQQPNNKTETITKFKLPLNKRNLKQSNKEAPYDVCSDVSISVVSNRTSSGAIKKHCELCDFKLIGNWSKHKKDIHNGNEVPSIKCQHPCQRCTNTHQLQQQETQSVIQQNKHGHFKEYTCLQCNKVKQSRYFPKNSNICAVCDKKVKVTKSAINVPFNDGNFFQLDDIPNQQHQIYPDDSISMVGNKRPAKKPLNFNKIMQNQSTNNEDNQIQLSFNIAQNQQTQYDNAQQSHKNQDHHIVNMIDTTMNDQSSSIDVSAVADNANINTFLTQLHEIEISTEDNNYVLSIKVAQFCTHFVTQQALALLRDGNTDKLVPIICMMLNEQADHLESDKLAGLFIAAFTLQDPCWTNAISMLQKQSLSNDVKTQYITRIFGSHIDLLYGENIAKWCTLHWRNIQEQQLNILKTIKGNSSATTILLLSIAVHVDDNQIEKFVEITTMLLKREFMKHMVASVNNRLTQQRLSLQNFFDLTQYLQLDTTTRILHSNINVLESIPLSQWKEKIEQYKSASHLMDSDSVQTQIQQYVTAYGETESLFAMNMFSHGSNLETLLHESENKPNYKQLASAQYSIGIARKSQRQLWTVPSGQGKGRIITFQCVLGISTQMFDKVHIVFENEHLKNRDFADFETVWTLMQCQDKVEYHVGFNFKTKENELIIIDESDTAMFESPEKFAQFIDGRICICLTATPDNCDNKGVESKVIQALNFKQYNYVPDLEQIDVETRLRLDDTIYIETMQDKVKYVQKAIQLNPLLIYGPQELNDTLITAGIVTITVDEHIDYEMLRNLDSTPYKVLFATDKFATRGIDYRSQKIPLELLIAQQFENTREALQGVARVGRFGDPCKRVKFSDIKDLVDKKRQLKYYTKQFAFTKKFDKNKVIAKQVKVKTAATIQQPISKGYTSNKGNIGRRQVDASQKKITDSFF